ncbi:MAG: biotin/lipoyl-containing protein [Bacteroidota bacterium]
MSNTTINIGEYVYSFDEVREILTDPEGNTIKADVTLISLGEYSVIVNGNSYHLFLTGGDTGSTATVNNFQFPIERETFREKLSKKLLKDSGTTTQTVTLRAPMPGMITKILKQEGMTVSPGDGILIVEAMKMENEIKALKAGILKKIFVKEKQTVEKNDNLFTIE